MFELFIFSSIISLYVSWIMLTSSFPNKIAQMQKAGYVPVATFVLPEHCWTDNFYELQVDAQHALLEKHAGNKTAEEFIAYQQYEAQLYDKYKSYYGYVFYIGKKI